MKADLETVIARRQAVANELKALEKMRAEMEAEDQDLIIAERVLRRLTDKSKAPGASNDVAATA